MTVALVSGVCGGIGAAIAQRLHADGHSVVMTDVAGDAFYQRVQELGFAGLPADLGQPDQVEALIATINQDHGAPGIVVNAAGGVRGQTGVPLNTVSDAAWREIFAANVDSAFHLAKFTLPLMQQLSKGRFVTISSGAGLRPSLTGIQAYTAAKHALVGLTRQLAMDYGKDGITVNSVAPGFILSNEASRRQWDSYGESGQQLLLNRIYTRRLGRPDDIASAVSFLVGDEAEWITGQVLQVDGGIT